MATLNDSKAQAIQLAIIRTLESRAATTEVKNTDGNVILGEIVPGSPKWAISGMMLSEMPLKVRVLYSQSNKHANHTNVSSYHDLFFFFFALNPGTTEMV